jgi:hypothetical protein
LTCNTLKSSRSQVNKSNKNHNPKIDDAEMVPDDRSSTMPQAKLAHLVVMIDSSGLKSAQRKRLQHSVKKLPCIDRVALHDKY